MSSVRDESFATTEEPHIVVWRLHGEPTVEQVRQIYDVQKRFCEGRQHVFLLIDSTGLTRLSRQARQALTDAPLPGGVMMPIRGIAVFGASFTLRIMGEMLAKAAEILQKVHIPPIRFFEHEAQARAWLTERSRELGILH